MKLPLRSALLLPCLISNVLAQARPGSDSDGVQRRDVLTAHVEPEKKLARIEIKEITLAAGAAVGLHLHPCPVVGTIIEGEIAFEIEGQPVQHLRAGDVFFEPAQTRIRRFDNEGSTPAKFFASYLLGPDDRLLIQKLTP